MTPEEREFCEEIRRQANRLAGIFCAIGTEVDASSMAGKLAERGGIAALGLATLAARRNIGADVQSEAQELAAADYDLAALKTAPSSGIED